MPPKTYRSLGIRQPSSMKAVARATGGNGRLGGISRFTDFPSSGWLGEVKPVDRAQLQKMRPENGRARTTSHCIVMGKRINLIDCLEIDNEIVITFVCPSDFSGVIPFEREGNILMAKNPSPITIGLPESTGKLISAESNNGIYVMRFGK